MKNRDLIGRDVNIILNASNTSPEEGKVLEVNDLFVMIKPSNPLNKRKMIIPWTSIMILEIMK